MDLKPFRAAIAGSADLVAEWLEVEMTAFALIDVTMAWRKGSANLSDVQLAQTDFAIAKASLATLVLEHRLELPQFDEWDILRYTEGIQAA